MLRNSLLAAAAVIGLALAGSGAEAQTLNRATLPQTPDRFPTRPAPIVEDTTHGAGTGPYAVSLNLPTGSVYLGTADSVTWQYGSALAPQATPRPQGRGWVNVTFAWNNSLVGKTLPSACYWFTMCTYTATMTIAQFSPMGLTTYTLSTAGNMGGNLPHVSFFFGSILFGGRLAATLVPR